MNKIRDGLLKESRFNILSKKRDDLFCIVNKYIHFVHSEYHFIQGDSEQLADRNNHPTFAFEIGKQYERTDLWNDENEV